MDEVKETKVCVKCGRELPVSNFCRSNKAKDGLQSYCKECQAAASRRRCKSKKDRPNFVPSSAHKVYYVEELAQFSNRDLIEELKARGFKGKLSYVYEIDV
jgi:hypothetical protein